MTTDSPSRQPSVAMVEALAVRAANATTHCEVIATDGDAPRWNGGCPHFVSAVKWEDGFLDSVCAKHALGAEQRGAVVVWTDAMHRWHERLRPPPVAPCADPACAVCVLWDEQQPSDAVGRADGFPHCDHCGDPCPERERGLLHDMSCPYVGCQEDR